MNNDYIVGALVNYCLDLKNCLYYWIFVVSFRENEQKGNYVLI